jgi:hypothetical protein
MCYERDMVFLVHMKVCTTGDFKVVTGLFTMRSVQKYNVLRLVTLIKYQPGLMLLHLET